MKLRFPETSDISRSVRFLKLKRLERSNSFPLEENLYLFSDPRGGSTWLTEILGRFFPKHEVLWEPLHLRQVSRFRKLGFGWRQHIPEGAEWEEAEQLMRKACEGGILTSWTTLRTTPERLSSAEGLLVKFCRGNALLPWFAAKFRPRRKPIFLVRHPFAVVSSQLKQGGWDYTYRGFGQPSGRYQDLYWKHKDYLDGLKHKDEALLATWCLSTLVTLRSPANNRNWLTLSYESLVLRPEDCLGSLFEGLGESRRFEDHIDSVRKEFRQPSSTTVAGSPLTGLSQLGHWKEQLEPQQIDRLLAVLKYFEVDEYTTDLGPTASLGELMST